MTLWPARQHIDTEYLDGPFKYLRSGWSFADLPEGRLQGHTFHYSKSETTLLPIVRARTPDNRDGEAIYRLERLTASYVHFYFPSNPTAIAALFS